MHELYDKAQNVLLQQTTQGIITLILVLTLCYVVVVDPSAYKDLFAYAVTGTLGFYFGRETKTNGGN